MINYNEFLNVKCSHSNSCGFDPLWVPDWLFPFQQHIVEWAIRKGRAAILADCGLGKTAMQLVWAENVRRHTNKTVLILTPLAVAQQTEREAAKFGIEAKHSRDGKVEAGIVIANYERLHYFNQDDFAAVVCDESSILKSFGGTRRKQITRFMSKMKYRLLCTATAAPNDYIELGTSAEALGEMTHSEMLRRFFKQLDDKGQKSEQNLQDQAEAIIAADPSYFQKLAYRVAQTIGQWRLKHHAVQAFWRWVASWAMACRMPSDLGFSDDGFVLPPLVEHDHIITPRKPPPGFLFNVPAKGMGDERTERRRTLDDRCEYVADLVKHDRPALIWCHMNQEGDLLEKLIPNSAQIAGKTPDERKEELLEAFTSGQLQRLISKPKIASFGLNFQHCAHVVTFATHSYEQYYQGLRRCYRFRQENPVRLDVIATEGECRVIGNMRRKAEKANAMFAALVREMSQANRIEHENPYVNEMEQPAWL